MQEKGLNFDRKFLYRIEGPCYDFNQIQIVNEGCIVALYVKKFGGSSVATPAKMEDIARRVLREKKPEDKVVIVVSAMGDSTDELLTLAKKVTNIHHGREIDMLITTGEQVSISLMAMTFQRLGTPAVSLTGAQAGVCCHGIHGKAVIDEVSPSRVFQELDKGNIVIVAGFQGVLPNGDIATLGRGGSDATAVALAGAMQADMCEIFTDVDGVYSADPRCCPEAVKMQEITNIEMLELARLGAGVMQPRSVGLGLHYHIPIHVRSTFTDEEGTIIREESTLEGNNCVIKGVAQDTHTARISVLNVKNIPGVAYKVFQSLADDNIDVDMIVQSVQTSNDNMTDIVFTIDNADLNDARKSLDKLKTEGLIHDVVYDDDTAKISIVGAGMLGTPGVAARMFGALGRAGVNILIVSTSEISVSCLVKREDVNQAVQAIHREFFGERKVNG